MLNLKNNRRDGIIEWGDEMKGLFLAILGAVAAWFAISFFTNDWDTTGLIYLILGIVVGYQVRKQNTEKSANDAL